MNRNVMVIQALSNMLAEREDTISNCEADLDHLRDRANTAETRSENLYNEVKVLREENDYLRGQVKDGGSSLLRGQARLFQAFLQYAEGMMKAMIWLRTPEAVALRQGNGKIAMIKRVRELTGLGLKEAKDYVESYMEEALKDDGVSIHAVCPTTEDLNPCKDTSCLND